jgi:hypothetical protein
MTLGEYQGEKNLQQRRFDEERFQTPDVHMAQGHI